MIDRRKLVLIFDTKDVVSLAKGNGIQITEDEAVMVMAQVTWGGSDRKAVEEVLMIYIRDHNDARKREAKNVQGQNP